MSESRPMRIISSPEDRTRMERAARGARIDKLSVDRSRYLALPIGRMSPEAMERDGRFEAIRSDTTVADRIAAWRTLFRLTVK